ncbi:MAG: hypothetical protein ACREOO_17695 [bacterium]
MLPALAGRCTLAAWRAGRAINNRNRRKNCTRGPSIWSDMH